MDWIRQNALRTALIVVLLGLNCVTLAIIWLQMSGHTGQPAGRDARPAESAALMQKTLNLNEEQMRAYTAMLEEFQREAKPCNDQLTEHKRRLAEELFAAAPDTAVARAEAGIIGALQARVEAIRFRHFHTFLAVCTPEQKDRLKPIVIEAFSKKPPREEPGGRQQDAQQREERRSPEKEQRPNRPQKEQRHPGEQQPERDERPAPPSMEEKISKYSERLHLSANQIRQLRDILTAAKQREDALRAQPHPDRSEIDAAKERIRKDEDDRIMKILTPEQQTEFRRMIANRKK